MANSLQTLWSDHLRLDMFTSGESDLDSIQQHLSTSLYVGLYDSMFLFLLGMNH